MAILNSYVKLPEGIASSDPFVGTSKRLLPILRAIFSGSLFELRNVARGGGKPTYKGARSIAKLVYNSGDIIGLMVDKSVANLQNQLIIKGAPHCRYETSMLSAANDPSGSMLAEKQIQMKSGKLPSGKQT